MIFFSFSWRAGAKEVIEKAKALCIKYILRYQTRPLPAPEHALVLPTFIFQKREEIALQMCTALKCAASPGNPSKPGSQLRSTDNTIKIETIVMSVDVLLGLLPELFEEQLIDRVALLQHDRWSCDASLARFFPWVVGKCGLSFATRTGRRVTVQVQEGKVSGLLGISMLLLSRDPSHLLFFVLTVNDKVGFSRMQLDAYDHSQCPRCSHSSKRSIGTDAQSHARANAISILACRLHPCREAPW